MKRMGRAVFGTVLTMVLAVYVQVGMAVDLDSDGMEDDYESFFLLDPNDPSDADQNFDSDSLDNEAESLLWTDPCAGDTDADGLLDDEDDVPLSRAVMLWGNPDFTDGDDYFYTAPDCWFSGFKDGGAWSNSCWMVSPHEHGQLWIMLNNTAISNNLVMDLFQLAPLNPSLSV